MTIHPPNLSLAIIFVPPQSKVVNYFVIETHSIRSGARYENPYSNLLLSFFLSTYAHTSISDTIGPFLSHIETRNHTPLRIFTKNKLIVKISQQFVRSWTCHQTHFGRLYLQHKIRYFSAAISIHNIGRKELGFHLLTRC